MVADAAPAEQFGPYLVYERLGVGGMATVHRALERNVEGIERIVALKRLLPHLAEDGNFIKAFVREAKLASQLNHVNIVHIFELGRVGTEYFISMEYIDGRDIRRILRHARKVTGPPPIHVTVGLLLQLCDALEYAHTKLDEQGKPMGLIHRDVSPSNLLITRAGHLKVIDFGIARAQSIQHKTQTGRVKGKLAYMAPEAIAGKDVDSRSDLFAVGVIAHELLTARPLFASKNEYQTLLKVQRGDILPPSTFNHACPPELDALVLKALARDPNERFAAARALRDELNALRRQYNLQTHHRDVAQWIEWAFSIEPPAGGFGANTLEHTGQDHGRLDARIAAAQARAGAPGHRGRPADDEEAAFDLAWGGGEAEQDGQPVVLDDVPDVSDKHLIGYRASDAAYAGDADDLDDDIPAPQPSHGVLPRARTAGGTPSFAPDATLPGAQAPAGPPRRNTAPGPGVRPARQTSGVSRQMLHGPGADTGPAERTSDVAAPRPARTTSGLMSPHEAERAISSAAADTDTDGEAAPESEAIGIGTMRNLPSLPPSARMSGGTVVSRELPSLDPGEVAEGGQYDDDQLTTLDRKKQVATPAPGLPLVPAPLPAPLPRPTIGAAIAQRRPRGASAAAAARRLPPKLWLVAGAIVFLGAAAGGAALFLSRGSRAKAPQEVVQEPAPQPPVRTAGTVKFVTEPTDAEITVQGHPMHKGSPWSIELPPGAHQIAIQRDGYKAWLTSLELSPNETYSLRVVLEPLGGGPQASAEATLILSTTPPGLEVMIDGQLLPQRTPLRMPLKPGRRVIVVRQDGQEVWRQEVDAKPSVDYEFTPSMTEAKQRERAERATEPANRAGARPAIVVDRTEPAAPTAIGEAEKTVERPADPASERVIESPTLPTISQITPPAAPPAEPLPPAAKGPAIVAPTAVTRVTGATPTLSKSRQAEVPAMVAAKVCIDTAGSVGAVEVLTKLERATAAELSLAIKSWTYKPYTQGGTAVPACFVVSFRVK